MKISKELAAEFDKIHRCLYNEKHEEILDPRPLAMPAGIKRPPTLLEQIERLMRGPLAAQAREQELETIDEADDFEDPEDDSRVELSGYEVYADDLPITMTPEEPPASPPADPPPAEPPAEPPEG